MHVGLPMVANNLVESSAGEQKLCSAIVEFPLSELLPPESSPRTAGENAAHIRMLAESSTAFPPIVVHRGTTQVIDGVHRLRAAQLRGDSTISAVLFDGSITEAFVLAVKLNAAHGLPLSLSDRKAAARRILMAYPQWSDRAIAAVAGISPKTVGVIRARGGGGVFRSGGGGGGLAYRQVRARVHAHQPHHPPPRADEDDDIGVPVAGPVQRCPGGVGAQQRHACGPFASAVPAMCQPTLVTDGSRLSLLTADSICRSSR
ncbi:ParB/RepB/Spo0J family partition protein [Nocardia brasiliensis]|uniref:ParB/RepB/Spo0J family partition protein n=1 Tax=Nocardia brasiliensis TaxID=37326 RepID=UPI0024567F39|nr:ParB N-terminal domain-containing protein [Nocardia brasiliensis]